MMACQSTYDISDELSVLHPDQVPIYRYFDALRLSGTFNCKS